MTKTRTSGPPRTVFYPMLREDPDICPVTTLRKYITVTTPCVANFETPKPVFITSRKPFRRARPATIGHWIKDTLKAAGVDTEKFTAHSTRSASTSHASMKGVPIADILKVANWSSSSTFERFYHRSSDPSAFARAVLQSRSDGRYVPCNHTCALNVPLVNTVPCIRNLRNTINRFPEDKVRTGRMDCMRR